MNRILTLGAKELLLTLRSKAAVFWIFIFPTLFAIFFGIVASGGGGSRSPLDVVVIDDAHTKGSAALIAKLKKSEGIRLMESNDSGAFTLERGRDRVRQGKATALLRIPSGYGERANAFWTGDKPLELGVDPSRKAEAGLLQGVFMQALFSDLGEQFTNPKAAKESVRESLASLEHAKDVSPETRQSLTQFLGALEHFVVSEDFGGGSAARFSPDDRIKKLDILPDEQGKPRSAFELTFPSSITWAMYGCILTFAISIVAERTTGTLVRLRMSPLTWSEIVAGKGLACFVASVVVACMLVLFASLFFGVRVGNILYLAIAIGSAAFCYTGLMMALASFGKVERDVAGAAAGVFMPLSMIGGAMIPRMFMPSWMQTISAISPIRWNIEALEGAIWRDYSLTEMALPCGVLFAVGILGLSIGVWSLSKTVD